MTSWESHSSPVGLGVLTCRTALNEEIRGRKVSVQRREALSVGLTFSSGYRAACLLVGYVPLTQAICFPEVLNVF